MDLWKDQLQTLISSNSIDESVVTIPENLDIISIVETLQPFMTHSDPAFRERAGIIFKCSIKSKFDTLDAQSLSMIKTFMMQKIEDAACVLEMLSAFKFIKSKNALIPTESAEICIKALGAIKNFRYGVENRQGIFKYVLDWLCHPETIEKASIGSFCEAFLNSIDSEKDPRNLLVIFNCVNSLSRVDLDDDYIEEFFESVFCYFPITFRSNPTDPFSLTVDDLKTSLRRAIAGDVRFGNIAVPLLIEKLSLSSNAAKNDALETLIEAASVYEAEAFVLSSYQLEIALFSEITGNSEPKIQDKALQLVRILTDKLPEGNARVGWMSKFLNEAVKAVELESSQIMSRSAVMIEAIASSCIDSFKFSLESAALPLLKVTKSENYSIKGQAARNCLVALFSPLKNNPEWIKQIDLQLKQTLEAFFDGLDCDFESFGVYLVFFSFISPCLSQACSFGFIKKFIDASERSKSFPSNELKNCIWLASRSCPEPFLIHFNQLENDQIISAAASTAGLATSSLYRLVELDRITSIEEVLLKSTLETVSTNADLVFKMVNLPINPTSLIKLISKCNSEMQASLLNNESNSKFELVIIAARPEAIELCKDRVIELIPSINNYETVVSLVNKSPEVFLDLFKTSDSIPAVIKALVYRMDSRAFSMLQTNMQAMSFDDCTSLFKNSVIEYDLLETHHVRKKIHLQWFLNFILNQCNNSQDNFKYLCILVSILSIAPSSLIKMYAENLFVLVQKFLVQSESFENAEILKSAWEALILILDNCSEIEVDGLVNLALKHINLEKEPLSIIRYNSAKVLSKLIEGSQSNRNKCTKWQEDVLSALKYGPLGDPKRAVRQEAAKANNLWIVLSEEGVFN